jgi:hypothetical protein
VGIFILVRYDRHYTRGVGLSAERHRYVAPHTTRLIWGDRGFDITNYLDTQLGECGNELGERDFQAGLRVDVRGGHFKNG